MSTTITGGLPWRAVWRKTVLLSIAALTASVGLATTPTHIVVPASAGASGGSMTGSAPAPIDTPLAPAPFSPITLSGAAGNVNAVVYEGDIYVADSTATTKLTGFTVPAGATAKTSYIVADGQCSPATFTAPIPCTTAAANAGSGNGDTLSFTGGVGTFNNGPDAFKGSDGCPWGPDACLWDTRNFDVSPYVKAGDTSATVTVTSAADSIGGFDCLEHQAQVLAVGPSAAFADAGYVAAGVGLRDQASGSINIAGIPPGSMVKQALLYWNVLSGNKPSTAMKINSHGVTGSSIGTDTGPCWTPSTSWAFRADVTAYVSGNGTYSLSGYPTGDISGINPWTESETPPDMEGASLLVFYQQGPVATTLVVTPPAQNATVGSKVCVTATVRDQFGNPMPGVVVNFTITGSQTINGSVTTDSNGEAQFCWIGPPLPGVDQVLAQAQSGLMPKGTATVTFLLPVSSPLCSIDITNGGWIIADNGDKVSFGGNVSADPLGTPSGQEQYTDSPAGLDVHSITMLAVTCSANLELADIYGQATINGSGSHFFRIEVADPDSSGGSDMYWILLDTGYDSGNHPLGGGHIEIHNS
jgi:hypothetical protein